MTKKPVIKWGLVILVLGIMTFTYGAKGCFLFRDKDDKDVIITGSSYTIILHGMVFRQTSDNSIVPVGGSRVTAYWSSAASQFVGSSVDKAIHGNRSVSTESSSDGSYTLSGIPRNAVVTFTIISDDATEIIETVNTASANINASAILKGRGKKIGLIKKNQESVFNTFDDTTMPACQISIPADATETDVDNVYLTPTHQGENLNPLPDGYIFLAGADFTAEDSEDEVTFASGKEATPYVILPAHIKAEDLSSADIKLMEFIDGNWVITTPAGEGKVFTTGEWTGYIGPDGATPAKLKGVRPWCWAKVQPSVARITGTVKDSAGNPIKGAFVFGGSRKTHTNSDGTYTLKNIAVINSDTLIPINATADGYQLSSQFVNLSPGGTVNDIDFTLESITLIQPGEIYGQITNTANANPIYGAIVTLQTNPMIRGMKYDDQGTTTDLTDDTFYVIPPPGVPISQYKWMLTLPNGTKFTSTLENGSSVVLNHLATEAGVSSTGAYKVELEVTYVSGKKTTVSGGFLLKISGLVLYIADVKLPVSLQDQLILKAMTNESGNYRFINLPIGETFYASAKADDFIASDPVQISALSAGEERQQNFGLAALTTDTEPPSQPGTLTGTAQSAFSILLTWSASNDNVGIDYYRVWRNGIEVGKTTATSYLDSGLQPSTLYQYIIGAFDKADNSALSSSVNVTTPSDVIDNTAPTTPTDLASVVISSNQINLSWFASWDEVGVTGYKVYRGGAQVDTTETTNYSDTGLTASTEYEYKVMAYDAAGNPSGFSNIITATASAAVDTTEPSVPTNLTAIAISSGQINITWTASTDNVGVTGYKVYRSPDGISYTLRATLGATTSYSDSGLSASTIYYYKVSAFDGAGNTSDLSSPDNATTDAFAGNLVAYWKFDESSGTNAADSSGNGNNGSVYGATWAGGILSFDGDDYVEINTGNILDLTAAWTTQGWVKTNDAGQWQTIFSNHDTSDRGIVLRIKDNNLNLWCAAGGLADIVAGFSVQSNTWYHIVAVYNGSGTASLYVNGTFVDSGAVSISNPVGYNACVGKYAGITGDLYYFNGLVDEVKIYDYARTQPEIQADYDATSSSNWAVVAAGVYHTVAIKTDGTLWVWGRNNYGQLGLGDYTVRNSPNQVGIDTDWASVAAGNSTTLARKTDGTLWVWGRNNYGQLGLGDSGEGTERIIPTQIGTDTDWAKIACGSNHTIAISITGGANTLWVWGANYGGQLGLGDYTNRNSPTQVGIDTDWAAVAVGSNYTIAIKTGGTLWAWGYNHYGQLGLGDSGEGTERIIPTQIGAGIDWVAVSTSSNRLHTIALKTGGTIWAWGKNNYGKLGLDDYTDRDTPTQVGIDTDWASVAAGSHHTLARKTDNTLWAWGCNKEGQSGFGNTDQAITPRKIGTDTDWIAVAAGGYSDRGYTLARKTDGTIWAWGRNESYGQLGLGDTDNRNTPTRIRQLIYP